MSAAKSQTRYTGQIGPAEFRAFDEIIREIGLSSLANGSGLSRGTLYNWMNAESLEAEPTSAVRMRQDRFLGYLGKLDSVRRSQQQGLIAAARFKQGAWRNRLSAWMARFYGLPDLSGAKNDRKLARRRMPVLPTAERKRWLGAEMFDCLAHGSQTIPLLTRAGWCPERLTLLSAVDGGANMKYHRSRPLPVEDLWPGLAETVNTAFGKKSTYNGFTYDVIGIAVRDGLPVFEFCGGRFYNQVNCGEGLLWELAIAASRLSDARLERKDTDWVEPTWVRGEMKDLWRRAKTRPFDIAGRSTGVGINTLTVMFHRRRPPVFLLHERGKHFHEPGSEEISTEAVNMWHVIPAGGWQPYDDDDAYHEFEYRLDRNILREFCEEVLAKEKLMRSLYINSPPEKVYSAESDPQLDAAKRMFDDGGVSHWYLGCGLDLLTLKLEMLTLLLVDGDRLDQEVSSEIPRVNREGRTHQYPFSQEEISRHLHHPELLPAGAGCLWLALEHFDDIVSMGRMLVDKPVNKT